MYRFATTVLRRCDDAELDYCLRINGWARNPGVGRFFTVVSRLGDGIFWYTLILVLPFVDGRAGILPAVQMSISGALGVLSYRWLKRHLVRERPYVAHAGVRCATRALDRYSFPSGHTLHAVLFSMLATHYYPGLALMLAPFTVLIALSRVVLGLHYPTDVVAGGLIGVVLALTSLAVAS